MGACSSSSSKPKSKANNLAPYLQATPFFYRLTPSQLENFASFFVLKRFSRESVIFDQNERIPETDIGSDFYVIIEGEVDFHTDGHYLCTKPEGDQFTDPILDPKAERRRLEKERANAKFGGGRAHGQALTNSTSARGRRLSADYQTFNPNTFNANTLINANTFNGNTLSRGNSKIDANQVEISGLDNNENNANANVTKNSTEPDLGSSLNSPLQRMQSRLNRKNGGSRHDLNVGVQGNARQRIATATARSNCTLMVLSAKQLGLFLKQNPLCQDAVLPLLCDPSESLSQLAFFKGINTKKLILLGMMLRSVALNSQDILFEEGSLGSSLYIVMEGTVKATVQVPDPNLHNTGLSSPHSRGSIMMDSPPHSPTHSTHDDNHSLASPRPLNHTNSNSSNNANSNTPTMLTKQLIQFTKNDIFGEISLIMDIPRTASITATEPCLLLELQRDSFQKFIKLVPNTVNLHNIMKSRTAEHFRKYKVPFFEAIPDDKYAKLASLCKIEQIPADQILFSEGDIGNTFYIIAYGEVKVTVKQKDPSSGEVIGQRELTRMGPGKYFGEIALVQDTPRTATVTSVSRCVILSITKENFQLFFNEAPEAIADFEVKLARYDVQLRSVLYHQTGLEFFVQHLRSEYSEENIEFWKTCRDFRHLELLDKDKRAPKIKQLAQVAENKSEEQVNPEFDEQRDIEIIQTLLSELRQRMSHDASYQAVQTENLQAMYEVFRDRNQSEYKVSDLAFKDMLYILDIDCSEREAELVCKELQFSPLAEITQEQFLAAMAKFTDPTYVSQELTKVQAPAKKKKSTENPTLTSIKILLHFQRAVFENHISQLRVVFIHCDKDLSGEIDFEEFASIMEALQASNHGICLNENELAQAFSAIDANGSGAISFAEFVHYHVVEHVQAKKLYEKRVQMARDMVKQFIGDTADRQVNIKGPTMMQIKNDLAANRVSVHLFDAAEDEVVKLMSSDSFARFKQSPLFQQLLDTVDSYKHVEAGNKEQRDYEKAKASFQKVKNAATGASDNTEVVQNKAEPTGFQPRVRSHTTVNTKEAVNSVRTAVTQSVEQLIDEIDTRRQRRKASLDFSPDASPSMNVKQLVEEIKEAETTQV